MDRHMLWIIPLGLAFYATLYTGGRDHARR